MLGKLLSKGRGLVSAILKRKNNREQYSARMSNERGRAAPSDEGTASKLRAAPPGPDFTFNGRVVLAQVVDAYDGDTVRLRWFEDDAAACPRLSAAAPIQWQCRLYGYDCAEIRPRKDLPGREGEMRAARAARQALLDQVGGIGGIVIARLLGFEKYGRVLCEIFCRDALRESSSGGAESSAASGAHVSAPVVSGADLSAPVVTSAVVLSPDSINSWMIRSGHGRPYQGGAK